MAADQRPPAPQVRAEQGPGEGIAGPVQHAHHQRGGQDHLASVVGAQPGGQPVVDHPQQPDQHEFQPVGPRRRRSQDAVEHEVAGPLPHHRGGHDGWGLVEGVPADRVLPGRWPIPTPAVHDPTTPAGGRAASVVASDCSAWSAARPRAVASSRRAASGRWRWALEVGVAVAAGVEPHQDVEATAGVSPMVVAVVDGVRGTRMPTLTDGIRSTPALRAAACGGRPRAGSTATAAGEPPSPSRRVVNGVTP